MIPPTFCSASSILRTSTRSRSGLTFPIGRPPVDAWQRARPHAARSRRARAVDGPAGGRSPPTGASSSLGLLARAHLVTAIEICFGLASSRCGSVTLQHAVLELGLDLLGVDHVRQREGAAERAVGALHAVVLLALHLGVELALAAAASARCSRPARRRPSGRSRAARPSAPGCPRARRCRRPAPRLPPSAQSSSAPRGDAPERLVEHPVHAVLDRHQVTERLPSHDCHSVSPPSDFERRQLPLTVYSASTTSPGGLGACRGPAAAPGLPPPVRRSACRAPRRACGSAASASRSRP